MKRLETLTGIRGFAALWVLLHHIHGEDMYRFIPFGFFTPIILRGYLAVDLFFILSGFIISYVHQTDFINPTKSKTLQFLGLRLARIMPVHWAVLLCLLLLQVVGYVTHIPPNHPESFTALSFFFNVINIQAWNVDTISTWNSPAWSISAEWFAYLLFPLMAGYFLRHQRPCKNLATYGGLFIGLIGFYVLLHTDNINWRYQYGTVRAAIEFGMGCCLYNLFKANWMANVSWDIITACAFLLGGALFIWTPLCDLNYVLLGSVILYGLPHLTGWSKAFWSSRVMVYLGTISFSLYLVHRLIMNVLKKVLVLADHHLKFVHYQDLPYVTLFIIIGASLVTAHFTYHFIEDPCRRKVRDWLQNRQNKTSQAASHNLKPL